MTSPVDETVKRGATATFGHIGHVPRRRTSFVGRDADVPAVMTILGDAPAVTLVGMGGVGKTSLAYEVASRFEAENSTIVHVVPLQATVDPDAVGRVVADSLGLPVNSQQRSTDAVVACLVDQGPTLLVLDNCEQVIDGAAGLVDELLDRCPDVRILATSRIVLGVEGEHVWPVDPLSVSGNDAEPSPAVQLLTDRATAAHPRALADTDVDKLVELADRLDGLPLALELAAARLSTMSIDELLEQLDDQLLGLESTRRGTEERHRSLAGVVEWSYNLLDDDARRAVQRLSVFPSTFTRESAERVMDSTDRAMLDRLLNDSLVTITERDGGARFLMLEMIRQFCGEKLEDSGEAAAARRAQGEWVVETMVELTDLTRGADAAVHRQRLVAELENVRVALAWAADEQEVDYLVQLARGLHDHMVGAAGREVHVWLERAVSAVWNDPDAMDVLVVGADAAMTRGDIARYREILERHDHLLEVNPEPRTVPGPGHLFLGHQLHWIALLIFEGKVEEAVELADTVAEVEAGDPWSRWWSLMRLSMPYAYAGQDEKAADFASRAVEVAENTGNSLAICWTRFCLGEALRSLEPERALASYQYAYDLADENGFTFLEGLTLVAWASALGRHGEPVEALGRYSDAIRWWRDAGGWSFLSTALRNFGEFLADIERPEEAVLVRCALEEISRSSRAGGEDADTDRVLRRKLTRQLGKSRFEELQERSHTLDESRVVELALVTIGEELESRRASAAAGTGGDEVPDVGSTVAPEPADTAAGSTQFQVIAFTDLESSTSYMADRGDRDARMSMREYDLRTNATLAEHRGTRVKSTGDGVLATFPTITDALEWIVQFQGSIEAAVDDGELPLRVRIGVHAGETIADMGDVFGTAVNLAARVVDRAAAGEVLVTDTVRQIAVGRTRSFSALGEVELKGIPEPIGLHRFEWR